MIMLRYIPLALIMGFGALAWLGPKSNAFNGPQLVRCAYELAALDAPPANVLFVGSSRFGRGFDHGYMRDRIRSKIDKDIVIERIALTFPQITQFRPPLENYLKARGAPDFVFLQVMYNFKPERQRRWDIPVNSVRNVSYANLDTLLDIRRNAKLNDHGTMLPRQYENGYLTLPALLLQKLEANIYAGMRYFPMKLRGILDECKGDALHYQARKTWLYKHLKDDIAFSETDEKRNRREQMTAKAKHYTSYMPNDPMRRFEVDQLMQTAETMTRAGSRVILVLLPVLGDTSVTEEELAEIKAIFPNYQLIHPYDLFDTEIGQDLAKSFADTHHATRYGALIYSRFFASEIIKLVR